MEEEVIQTHSLFCHSLAASIDDTFLPSVRITKCFVKKVRSSVHLNIEKIFIYFFLNITIQFKNGALKSYSPLVSLLSEYLSTRTIVRWFYAYQRRIASFVWCLYTIWENDLTRTIYWTGGIVKPISIFVVWKMKKKKKLTTRKIRWNFTVVYSTDGR